MAVAALAAGCGERTRDRPLRVPAEWLRGMNVTAFSADGYAERPATAALRRLRGTGTTHVALVVTWYVDDARDPTVEPHPDKSPTFVSVEAAASAAQALGLEVWLKPHVDALDGTFRGRLAPSDRDAWFRSYGRLLEELAGVADRVGAGGFVVGTELASLDREERRWRQLVERVRERYGGTLTYAANWVQDAERVRFWDALDLVGIDAYMPLTPGDPDPSVRELVAAWSPWIARAARVHRRARRPVVLTEVGFASRRGTAQEPATEPDGPVSQAAQARAYEATLRAWTAQPWVRGAFWWNWDLEGRNARVVDGSYRPAGKRAERVLRRWYAPASD